MFLAEDDEGPVGVARIEEPQRGRAHLQLVYVRPRARRQGVGKALLAECVADAKTRGAEWVSLEVLTSNELGVTAWRRLGFVEYSYEMAARLDALQQRLNEGPHGASHATTHAQTDDEVSVERAIAQFIPASTCACVPEPVLVRTLPTKICVCPGRSKRPRPAMENGSCA